VTARPEILSTQTAALFQAAVRRAADLLRAGEVVALPTETVYGLAANALDARAVAKIFEAKGRPAHNPVIVHVTSLAMARRCAREWPSLADTLAAAFWPGPLTLVLPRANEIPDNVTAGGDTVGIRWPSHPFIQAVIRACDFPLAAPSANVSNQISPTNAAHVRDSLGGRIRMIVDGGQAQVGLESTVLDVTSRPLRVLRPGMIHLESLAAVVGADNVETADSATDKGSPEKRRSPGLLRKHYSPRAKLVVWSWPDETDLAAQLAAFQVRPSATCVIAYSQIPLGESWRRISVIPHDSEAFARAIYAELHQCDATGAEWIVVEAPPDTPEWRAIADRLGRAAAS
jgi:L-threonylcarbamoyladenylate synthase